MLTACARSFRRPGRAAAGGAAVLALLLAGACSAPDPTKELSVIGAETYWVIQSAAGDTTYITPAVRFYVKNVGTRSWRAVFLSAAFRRVGHKQEWGAGWARVPEIGKLFKPGEKALVEMVADQGRYYSTGPAARMFQHKEFEDAEVEAYVQMAGSKPTRLYAARVERRIGSRAAQEYLR